LAWLLTVMLATGCSSGNTDKAQPTPRALTGETIKQVLLDDAALSKMLNQPFQADSKWPPSFGGADKLDRPIGPASPADCAGVALMTQQSAYQPANVRNVAREYWWNIPSAGLTKVLSVSEGVVALSTAADATALFGKFSEQWTKCQGQMVTTDGGRVTFSYQISDVRKADPVLAATVLVETRATGTSTAVSRHDARALGVRGNCLVEVNVAFFDNEDQSFKGTGDIHTSAIDIAHAMMDKVASLS
jgi:hypothetical protein